MMHSAARSAVRRAAVYSSHIPPATPALAAAALRRARNWPSHVACSAPCAALAARPFAATSAGNGGDKEPQVRGATGAAAEHAGKEGKAATAKVSGTAEGEAGAKAANASAAAPSSEDRTLWSASSLEGHYYAAESVVDRSTIAMGGGVCTALLGLAPLAPPEPFGLALLLAIYQVYLGRQWQLHTLRLQLRRHVVKVVLPAGSALGNDATALTTQLELHCDGGLIRRISLALPDVDANDDKLPLKDVVDHAGILFFDSQGKAADGDAFEACVRSERVICTEELKVAKYFEGEAANRATHGLRPLSELTREQFRELTKSAQGILGPDAAMRDEAARAWSTAKLTLYGGFVLFLISSYFGDAMLEKLIDE